MTCKVLAERYEVQRQLGKQTGRQTLLARDLQTQKLVVIKQLFLGSDFEWQDLKLFEREAETLKALSHPAIPRYLDYLEIDEPDSKGFGLVQTYVEGKTLEEHLRSGRTFSVNELKELAKKLLEILNYLHKQNPPVIHRDLKPSNILLHSRSGNSIGKIYLVDFGSVQNQAAKFGGTITVVGTYGYMAPEQFGGRSVPASDLYSLGATLIYLVTGLHPTELSQQDLKIKFADRATHLNPSLIDWLEWMTEPSLSKRLSSAEEAWRALKNPRSIDKNHKDYITLQPPGSEIKLTKNSEFVEIVIPSQEVSLGLSALLVTAVAANIVPFGCLLLYILHAINYGSKITNLPIDSQVIIMIAGGYLALVGVMLARVGVMFLLALFRRELRLTIDRQQISCSSHLLGLRWNHAKPSPRNEICQLKIQQREYRNSGIGVKVIKVIKVMIFAFSIPRELYQTASLLMQEGHSEARLGKVYQMIVQAGNHKYQLGEKEGLSESEIKWLATELSQWLGLKIKIILTDGKQNKWF
ncbi:serine/threonine-protein kinase [Microcoleus sp. S36b_A3]|uniref:serine/threonine protein kinase n=1 Tax=unclassified Microcoleus TaxID=2642155 RepID=UPI002FD576BA